MKELTIRRKYSKSLYLKRSIIIQTLIAAISINPMVKIQKLDHNLQTIKKIQYIHSLLVKRDKLMGAKELIK